MTNCATTDELSSLTCTSTRWTSKVGLSNRVDTVFKHSSSSTPVPDSHAPVQHTLTHQHHVSATAVLRMIHHPHNTGTVGVLTIEEQGERVINEVYRETDGLQSVTVTPQLHYYTTKCSYMCTMSVETDRCP